MGGAGASRERRVPVGDVATAKTKHALAKNGDGGGQCDGRGCARERRSSRVGAVFVAQRSVTLMDELERGRVGWPR